ncbi:MAG TPA: hypothetical protein VIV11_26700 [Kofleriaceae bacterium]
MRKLLCIAIAFVSACGGCDEDDPVVFTDALVDMDIGPCNVLTQAGCTAGEKCTWIVDAIMPQYVGHIGCAPAGAAAVGTACMYGAPGPMGYDNCAGGLVCSNFRMGAGECKQICDNQGGQPMCDAQHVCVTYADLFETGDTTPPAGGVCDLACDPLTDNDYDGSGSASMKTGTTCGTNAANGCYGYPSSGSPPATGWSCGGDVNMNQAQPTGLRHRVQCVEANGCADPGPVIYVNSCNQGYLPLLRESTMVSTAICTALCKPRNCYMGNCGGATNPDRLGEMPHRCITPDRVGTFDTGAGGEHCRYIWSFEIDMQGNFLRSPTSDTMGFCFDHSKYLYDSDNNNMPDTPLPACATLPDGFGSATTFGAGDLGCVDTTHVQLVNGKAPKLRTFDDLRPLTKRYMTGQ